MIQKEYKIRKDCIFCSQLRENHKITNMYQKARVDDLESSTRSNKNSPNTPEKSQLKKWLGIAGATASIAVAITIIIVIATTVVYWYIDNQTETNQSKCQNNGTLIEINGNFTCDCEGTGFDGQFCQNGMYENIFN